MMGIDFNRRTTAEDYPHKGTLWKKGFWKPVYRRVLALENLKIEFNDRVIREILVVIFLETCGDIQNIKATTRCEWRCWNGKEVDEDKYLFLKEKA